MTGGTEGRVESVLVFLLWYLCWTQLDRMLVYSPATETVLVLGACACVLFLNSRRRGGDTGVYAQARDAQKTTEVSLSTPLEPATELAHEPV